MKILVLLLLIMLLIGITAASTVTLTGTCYSNIINQTNNYITFNLTNSGNGTATNFLIAPIMEGASALNSTISIPLVAPGSTHSERIYLSNFTIPGSYVERFVTRYSQDTSTFVTFFPCLVEIGQNAPSILAITNLTKEKNNSITIKISNIANYPIAAQVSVYAPPDFIIANSSRDITLRQYASTSASFMVSTPQYTNSEFPVVVATSYVSNGVHYATLAETTISFGAAVGSASSSFTGSLLVYGIAALIMAIIVLIALSIILKKGKHEEKGASMLKESGSGHHHTGKEAGKEG